MEINVLYMLPVKLSNVFFWLFGGFICCVRGGCRKSVKKVYCSVAFHGGTSVNPLPLLFQLQQNLNNSNGECGLKLSAMCRNSLMNFSGNVCLEWHR